MKLTATQIKFMTELKKLGGKALWNDLKNENGKPFHSGAIDGLVVRKIIKSTYDTITYLTTYEILNKEI